MVLKNKQTDEQITSGTALPKINISEKQAALYLDDKTTKCNKYKERVQLEDFKAVIKNKFSVKTPEIDKQIVNNSINVTTNKADNSRYIYTAPSERFNSNAVSIKQSGKQDTMQFSDNMYPNKIEIPEDKFVKGYLYKVKDCFYDDDGEFLYRVPGLY